MPPTPLYVLLDFDDLVWDVISFVLALCRAASRRKLSLSDLVRNDIHVLNPTACAHRLLSDERKIIESTTITADAEDDDASPPANEWSAELERLLELNKELVKPRVGCTVLLEELQQLQGVKVVLVSFCQLRIDSVAGNILQSVRPVPRTKPFTGDHPLVDASFCELSTDTSSLPSSATKWSDVLPIPDNPFAYKNTVTLTSRKGFTKSFAKHGITGTVKYDHGDPLRSISYIATMAMTECNHNEVQCNHSEVRRREAEYQWRVQPGNAVPQRSLVEEPELDCWRVVRFFDSRVLLEGMVVSGFNRGSNQLGIPTANMDATTALDATTGAVLSISSFVPGVYFGWAAFVTHCDASCEHLVNRDTRFGMVMSVGYNPYYKNSKLTIEPHLFGYEGPDFKGSILRLEIVGFGRVEADFGNFGQLVRAIQNDCEVARETLKVKAATTHQ
eukprot:Lankesteria_metandrocarpae@DN3688_c0_g1_i1.p1